MTTLEIDSTFYKLCESFNKSNTSSNTASHKDDIYVFVIIITNFIYRENRLRMPQDNMQCNVVARL